MSSIEDTATAEASQITLLSSFCKWYFGALIEIKILLAFSNRKNLLIASYERKLHFEGALRDSQSTVQTSPKQFRKTIECYQQSFINRYLRSFTDSKQLFRV